MRQSSTFLALSIVFLLFITTPLRTQVYVDALLGVLVYDGDHTAGVDLAIGRQQSRHLGYGINIRSMYSSTISTSNTFNMLGAQYRILDNKHRLYGKLEIGSLLSAKYTTDSELVYEYESRFNPYFRVYTGYRFRRCSVGVNYTYIAPFLELIYSYDDNAGEYFSTNQYRARSFHNLQLYLGFRIDSYKVSSSR